MMIKLLILFFFFQTSELRNDYAQASQTRERSEQFVKKTAAYDKKSKAVYQAYKGAAMIISAKYESGLFQKTKLVKEGIKWIDEAIAQDKTSLEIRMIRHSIQSNLPKILGYYKNMDEDRSLLNNNVSKLQDEALKKYINLYLKNTK